MSTIYSELLAAAGAEFLPQAEGEPDAHYLRRLVLAVSKASDSDWEHLSKEAQDWYNAQAKRVKAQQDPQECPGFGILDGHDGPVDNDSYKAAYPDGPIVDAVIDAGWPDRGPEGDIHIVSDSPVESEHTFNPSEAAHVPLAAKDGQFVAPADQDSPHALDWPVVSKSQLEAVKNGTSRLEDQDGNHIVVLPKHTATDAIRAIVMQHQDYNRSQIAAELEANGQPVNLGTITTVRSMTLSTIAVAKSLGKWVEG